MTLIMLEAMRAAYLLPPCLLRDRLRHLSEPASGRRLDPGRGTWATGSIASAWPSPERRFPEERPLFDRSRRVRMPGSHSSLEVPPPPAPMQIPPSPAQQKKEGRAVIPAVPRLVREGIWISALSVASKLLGILREGVLAWAFGTSGV